MEQGWEVDGQVDERGEFGVDPNADGVCLEGLRYSRMGSGGVVESDWLRGFLNSGWQNSFKWQKSDL